jgi:hypothetical protein
LPSSHWDDRVRQANESADGRIRIAAAEARSVEDAAFLRLCLVLALFFVLLILYRLTSLVLARRMVPATTAGAGRRQPTAARRETSVVPGAAERRHVDSNEISPAAPPATDARETDRWRPTT